MLKKKKRYFDSLKSYIIAIINLLKFYSGENYELINEKFNFNEWQIYDVKQISLQNNGCDCGVFTLLYSYFLLLELPFQFCQDDILQYRDKK